MDENKSGLYIVAIVGAIAIVALVVLVLGASTRTTVVPGSSFAAEDTAGQAIYIGGSTCSSNADCKDPWCCVSVNGKNRCGSCSIGRD